MKYDCEKIGRTILSERKKHSLSQAELGNKIGVVGKQISNYETGKLIPPIDVMLDLCEVFNCELGYLLGEDDYSERTKIETIITQSTGLNVDALKNIRKITGDNKNCLHFGYESESYRLILNKILSSPLFIDFIECLYELDISATSSQKGLVDIEKRIGKEYSSEAFELYNTFGNDTDPNASELEPEQYEALRLIDSAIDKQHDLSYSIKVARYELRESFESLIESLYPRIE